MGVDGVGQGSASPWKPPLEPLELVELAPLLLDDDPPLLEAAPLLLLALKPLLLALNPLLEPAPLEVPLLLPLPPELDVLLAPEPLSSPVPPKPVFVTGEAHPWPPHRSGATIAAAGSATKKRVSSIETLLSLAAPGCAGFCP